MLLHMHFVRVWIVPWMSCWDFPLHQSWWPNLEWEISWIHLEYVLTWVLGFFNFWGILSDVKRLVDFMEGFCSSLVETIKCNCFLSLEWQFVRRVIQGLVVFMFLHMTHTQIEKQNSLLHYLCSQPLHLENSLSPLHVSFAMHKMFSL